MTIVSNLVLLAGVLSHCLAWFNALPEPGNHFERQDEAYSHKANRCARSQGFSVNVKLFQKNIQWKGHEYTRDTLAEALGAEVSKRSLPMTAVRRAPFVVDVAEDVRCGPLLELFDMAEGLGFVVKGFNLLFDVPNAPHLDTNESVVLPRFQSSLPIAEREMELFACVITLLDDNVVMMDGARYSCATSELTDELFFAIQAKCRRYKASCPMNSPVRALLYANVNVSARRLEDVMVQCFNGGIRSFYAVGCSESGTDRRGLRCVRFDMMLPNGFYWGREQSDSGASCHAEVERTVESQGRHCRDAKD